MASVSVTGISNSNTSGSGRSSGSVDGKELCNRHQYELKRSLHSAHLDVTSFM